MAENNPFATVLQMAGGYCLSRSLHALAECGIADALKGEPQTAADLASACGVNADALARMLRLLSAHGIFRSEGDRFAHSPASELLRGDHPQSMKDLVRMFGLNVNWKIYESMEHTLRTGRPAAEKVLPNGFWGYFADHPEENAIFNAAMTGKASAQVAAIIAVV